MKISDLLAETADSIFTYLAILGNDIVYYEKGSDSVKEQYKNNPIPNNKLATQTILNEVNSRILALISDIELWNRFESDPEVEVVYNRFINLYNQNIDYIETLQ